MCSKIMNLIPGKYHQYYISKRRTTLISQNMHGISVKYIHNPFMLIYDQFNRWKKI